MVYELLDSTVGHEEYFIRNHQCIFIQSQSICFIIHFFVVFNASFDSLLFAYFVCSVNDNLDILQSVFTLLSLILAGQ